MRLGDPDVGVPRDSVSVLPSGRLHAREIFDGELMRDIDKIIDRLLPFVAGFLFGWCLVLAVAALAGV